MSAMILPLAIALAVMDEPRPLEPVPDKLVVLTFDDSVKSHFTVVRPILKKHGFGATFFVTEGFEFKTNKDHYMTWEEIARLDSDGFEIGNHTRDHLVLDGKPGKIERFAEQLQAIADRCREYGIPAPTSFAWPGNGTHPAALAILKEAGIRFARRGGEPEYDYKEGRGVAYEPLLDHPLLIPSAGDARPDWSLDDFKRAVAQARAGRIAVVQFHGVPDVAHLWVNTPVERFEEYMQYLADGGFKVIAMRDLAKYVDPEIEPRDPQFVIRDRQQRIAAGKPLDDARRPATDDELRRWLENMVWHHRFTPAEIEAATGLSRDEVTAALARFDIRPDTRPTPPFPPLPRGGKGGSPLLVLPYPGGRHPRIGFRDGAIRPQRETKLSVFLPWEDAGYVVLDVPEAIRWHDEAERGLLYLAHTHVPTVWTKEGFELEPLEWRRDDAGHLTVERRLPNGVVFGTKVVPARDAVRMQMWLTNGTEETLRSLRVQNCVMLAGAPEFAERTNDNKLFWKSYAACRSRSGRRWIITAWQPALRTWGNAPCPCLHSDPQFADCPPGETVRLSGWLSFYEGDDIEAELKRIEQTAWAEDEPRQRR
ncbi:MAG: polysaccharide deacetylase family protein [Planctomycetes bacterium]|nr:polysaccharide deacetylase family protein [Planctomycetota bacterium]